MLQFFNCLVKLHCKQNRSKGDGNDICNGFSQIDGHGLVRNKLGDKVDQRQ